MTTTPSFADIHHANIHHADIHHADPAIRQRAYRSVVERIREVVSEHTVRGSTVVVVSRGDPQLVSFTGRRAWHFPRDKQGRYAGHHPATSEDAIAHLEDIRSGGGDYLLFPRTASWWLDHYDAFRDHLEASYPAVTDDACTLFLLRDVADDEPAPPTADIEASGTDALDPRLGELVDSLLPDDATVVLLSTADAQTTPGSRTTRRLLVRADEHDDAVIRRIQALRVGADYLVVASCAYDWLRCHPRVGAHLVGAYRQLTHQAHLGAIYDVKTGKGQP